MAAWFRSPKPIWAALTFTRSSGLSSVARGCPTRLAQTGFATSPNESIKAYVLVTAPDHTNTSRTLWTSAGSFALQDATAKSSGDAKKQTSKRSLSGWNRFVKDQFKEREELKKELKDAPAAKIDIAKATRDIAAKWKSLSEKEKKPYLDAANASKPKPKPKTGNGLNGYSLFVKENVEGVKARNPTIRSKEVLISMRHEWKSKSDADKEKYNKRAEKLRHNDTL